MAVYPLFKLTIICFFINYSSKAFLILQQIVSKYLQPATKFSNCVKSILFFFNCPKHFNFYSNYISSVFHQANCPAYPWLSAADALYTPLTGYFSTHLANGENIEAVKKPLYQDQSTVRVCKIRTQALYHYLRSNMSHTAEIVIIALAIPLSSMGFLAPCIS